MDEDPNLVTLDQISDDEFLKEDWVDLESLLDRELEAEADMKYEDFTEIIILQPQSTTMRNLEAIGLSPDDENFQTDTLSVSPDSSNMDSNFSEQPPVAIDQETTSFGSSNQYQFQLPTPESEPKSISDPTSTELTKTTQADGLTSEEENRETLTSPDSKDISNEGVATETINTDENFNAPQFEETRIVQESQEDLLVTKNKIVFAKNESHTVEELIAALLGEPDEQYPTGFQSDLIPPGDLETPTSTNEKTEPLPTTTGTSVDSSTADSLVHTETKSSEPTLRENDNDRPVTHVRLAFDPEIDIIYYTEDVGKFFKKEEPEHDDSPDILIPPE